MRGMAGESVDLIYLDPPFNSNHNYAAPIGSKAAGAHFRDTWTLGDVDLTWWGQIANKNPALYSVLDAIARTGGDSMMSYSIYMAIRIIEMHRILKSTGSLYLHCDPTAGHYLRIILDTIFGPKNFKNEIIWKRATSGQKGSQFKAKKLGAVHDIIHWYVKSSKHARLKIPTKQLTQEQLAKLFPYEDEHGRYKDDSSHIFSTPGMSARPNLCYTWRGITNPHPSGWRLSKERLEEEFRKGNILINKRGRVERRARLKDYRGENLNDLWLDISSLSSNKERLGYPTQKPLALLERIIKMSSEKGDIIMDPFCGCATACIAAEKLGRQWIGIDLSELAMKLIKRRLQMEFPMEQFMDRIAQVISRTEPPVLEGVRSPNIKEILYGRQKGYCAGCNVHFPYKNLTIDHILPKSKGGSDIDDNKQLLCNSCNSIKGNRLTTEELKTKLKQMKVLDKS